MKDLLLAFVFWSIMIVGCVATVAGLMAVIFNPTAWLSWAIFIGGYLLTRIGFKQLNKMALSYDRH